ncbi:hypothetical protein ED236_12300, partial [Pseudomethylobacillus aquaticus]
LDMRTMTLAEVINQRALDVQNEVTQQTQYTFSVYDARQQLIQTIQPPMESMTAEINMEAVLDAGLVTASYGEITWNMQLVYEHSHEYGAWYFFTVTTINIPESTFPGNASYRVKFLYDIDNYVDRSHEYVQKGPSEYGSAGTIVNKVPMGMDHEDNIYKFSYEIYLRTDEGELLVATGGRDATPENPLTGGAVYPPPSSSPWEWNFVTSKVMNSSGSGAIDDALYFTNQPYVPGNSTNSTSRLLLSYRPVGSTAGYTTVLVPPALIRGGMYAFDWTTIPAGHYEYRYIALNHLGTILNQQSGRFNTTNPAAPTTSPQALITTGNAGYVSVIGVGESSVSAGLHLIDQGSHAKSVLMRYRVKGSSGAWTTLPASSFVAGTASSGFGVGSFSLPTSAMGVFANNTQYEVEFDVHDANNKLIRTSAGTLSRNAAGHVNMGELLAYPKLTFLQPIHAKYLDVRYRVAGSTGAYSDAIRLTPTSTNSGRFDWAPNALIPNLANRYDYEFDLQALDAANQLVNQTQATVQLGSTVTVLSTSDSSTAGFGSGIISSDALSSLTILRRQRYNAFGEVVQEIDGRGNVTDFAYNTAGNLVLKRDPKVNITLVNGFVQAASEATRPETAYHYDLAGRLIGVRDANGNLNTQAWITGARPESGTESADMVSLERHADGGIRTAKFDIFGDKRMEVDEASRRTDYT